MNIETYEDCIRQLENQIKSREKQRQSMEITIMDLDRQLGIEVQKNRNMRDEIGFLVGKNQSIIKELHHLEQLLQEKERTIQSSLLADQGRRSYIESLQKEKHELEEQIKQQDLALSQQKIQMIDLERELRTRDELIEGYKKQVGERDQIITEKQRKFQDTLKQVLRVKEQLAGTILRHELEKHDMLKKLAESQGSANSIVSQLQQEIHALQTQLEQARQFNLNQLQVVRFNHESQVGEMLKHISGLQEKINSQLEEITHLREEEKKLKQHYEIQIQNNDKVVSSLINEINFLKEEKVQIKKQNALKLEETVQQIFMMGLEIADRENKAKAQEQEVRSLKDQLSRKDSQVSNLNKEIQKLQLQLEVTNKQHSNQKTQVSRKNQEISELKRYIDNLKKLSLTADKQKQLLNKKTAREIDSLKNELTEANQKLQRAVAELQQLRIVKVQLQDQVKFLGMEKSSSSQSQSELQQLIKTHQFTIQKLHAMNEQTKKVVIDLNKLLKSKLAEIQSLQLSNLMFRKEKLDWIKKEEEYRKKIAEIRNSRKLMSNESSFLSRATRKSQNNQNILTPRNDKFITHSMVAPGHSNADKLPYANTASFVNGFRSKTMVPVNWSSTHEARRKMSQSGSVQNDFPVQNPTHKLNEQAFKKPQAKEARKKSVEFPSIVQEMPVVPVLIQMNREKIQEQANQDTARQLIQGKTQIKPEDNSPTNIEEPAQNIQQPKIIQTPETEIKPQIQSKVGQVVQQQQDGQDKQLQTEKLKQKQDQTQKHILQTKQQNKVETKIQEPQHEFESGHKNNKNDEPQNQNQQGQKSQQVVEQKQQPKDQQQPELDQAAYERQTLEFIREQEERLKAIKNGTYKQLDIEAQCPIPKKISPINSRVLIKQDSLKLGEISEDDELNQHELSELNDLKQTQAPLTHQEHDHIWAQNTVNGINQLLDRLDVASNE